LSRNREAWFEPFDTSTESVERGDPLATLPILILYAIGRRQLLSGLTAGFSK
jgi:raffinose/stachyose/melibiose transport system permease protein